MCNLAYIGTCNKCVKIDLKLSTICKKNVRKPHAAGADFFDPLYTIDQ